MVKSRQTKVEWLDVPDIDQDCSLVDLAKWILDGLETGETEFAKHKGWKSFRLDSLNVAIQMAFIEGKMFGASEALALTGEINARLSRAAGKRAAELELAYEEFRLEWIKKVEASLLDATRMWRELPHGGRAVKLLPDYDNSTTSKAEMMEFHIAVQLYERKKQMGKMKGLTKMVNDATASGMLNDDGNAPDRIKQRVNRMWEFKDIYLPPTILALHERAVERVEKAKDFVNSLV